MKTTFSITRLALLAPLVFIIGCGGGTDSVPRITVKPKKAAKTIPGKTPGGEPGTKTPTGDTGTFSGVIVFDGTAPTIGNPSSFDPNGAKTDGICKKNSAKVLDLSLVVDPKSKGVKNVFIYLVKKPKNFTPDPAPKTPKLFDQKFCTFTPHAMVVRVGQPVEVNNTDETGHNTHTHPANSAVTNANLGTGDKITYTFGDKEKSPVKVSCDIHGWMGAWQLPVDNDFWFLTKADGKFEIKGLPPGDYQFNIWHEKTKYLRKAFDVTIEGGDTVTETVTMKPKNFTTSNGPSPKTVILSLNR